MDQKTIDTYDKMAKEYDAETSDFWNRFPKDIIDTFAGSVNGKILDIGSGPGRDGLLLKNLGLDIVCLDASAEMVKIAQERGLNAVVGDFMELPFVADEFDGVWAYTSLLHVPKSDTGKAFLEIVRVLKKGGALGLGLIEGDEELYRESSGVNMPRWFSFYTEQEVRELLFEYGLKEIFFQKFSTGTKNYLNFIAIKE